MSEYEFTLKFRLPDLEVDPEDYLDSLFEAGCDDAVVGIGHTGHIAMEFLREAESVEHAITSAIQNVRDAIKGTILIEASPDIVGLTDAAELLHFSRQYMRELREKNPEFFPLPLHSGKSALYNLADIFDFINTRTTRKVEGPAVDVAIFNRRLNMYRNMITVMHQSHTSDKDIDSLIPEDVREILQNSYHLAG